MALPVVDCQHYSLFLQCTYIVIDILSNGAENKITTLLQNLELQCATL